MVQIPHQTAQIQQTALQQITNKLRDMEDRVYEVVEEIKKAFEEATKDLSRLEYEEVMRELIEDFEVRLEISEQEED